jgi:hypothetical protein
MGTSVPKQDGYYSNRTMVEMTPFDIAILWKTDRRDNGEEDSPQRTRSTQRREMLSVFKQDEKCFLCDLCVLCGKGFLSLQSRSLPRTPIRGSLAPLPLAIPCFFPVRSSL